MLLSYSDYILLCVSIFFAGFVDSIAGGGGLITVPTYIALGLPSHLILGTNKCVSTIGGSVSIFRYIKNKSIDFNLMKYGIIAGVFGSFFGARLSLYLDSKKMIYLLLILVPIILFLNFKKSKIKKDLSITLTGKQLAIRVFLIGLLIGAYDGFFGPGTGTFLIISLVYFANFSMIKASPNARVINYASNIAAFLYFISSGLIAWKIASIAIVSSMLGNYLGSHFVLKENLKVVGIVFNCVLVGLLVKSVYQVYTS